MKGKKLIFLAVGIFLIFARCSTVRDIPGGDANFNKEISTYIRKITSETKPDKSPVIDENATLSDYLVYGAMNNPELQAAFHRWKASLERIPQVRALPDPRFTYVYFIREVETRAGSQEQRASLSQLFPWFGKLDLRGDIAFKESEAERHRFEAAKYKLFFDIRKAYYEYYYLGQSIAVTEENLELLKYLEEIARARLRVANEAAKDLSKVQVELGKLDDRLKELRTMRPSLIAKLNESLNLPPETFLPFPRSIPHENIDLSDEVLIEWIRSKSPELKALKAKILGAKKAVKLAKKEYFPDITLGVESTDTEDNGVKGFKDSGKDAYAASLSLNVPIWYKKYRAGEREAQERLAYARKDYKSRANSLFADLKRITFGLRDSERRISFYHDTLIPITEHSLLMTQQAYQFGEGEFLDVIDTQRSLLEFNLAYERALTDNALWLAELEKLVGTKIPRKDEVR